MTDITAVIIAKNEEKNIVDCLEALAWCREIIVVDDFSEDRTTEIARINGAQIFKHELDADFSKQRNFGLSKCKTEWVLFVDADERVSEKLRKEIEYQISESNDIDGFILKREDILWGRSLKHGETAKVKLLRIARGNLGRWEQKVHEVWKVEGKTKELINPLIHYPHQDISTILSEINFYTDIRAEELREQGVKASFFQIIFYPIVKFTVNYFIKLGFLDGIIGLIMANIMSFHSFLARGKLWQITKKD